MKIVKNVTSFSNLWKIFYPPFSLHDLKFFGYFKENFACYCNFHLIFFHILINFFPDDEDCQECDVILESLNIFYPPFSLNKLKFFGYF